MHASQLMHLCHSRFRKPSNDHFKQFNIKSSLEKFHKKHRGHSSYLQLPLSFFTFYKHTPTIRAVMGSPMLIDQSHGQQHGGLHHPVFKL